MHEFFCGYLYHTIIVFDSIHGTHFGGNTYRSLFIVSGISFYEKKNYILKKKASEQKTVSTDCSGTLFLSFYKGISRKKRDTVVSVA